MECDGNMNCTKYSICHRNKKKKKKANSNASSIEENLFDNSGKYNLYDEVAAGNGFTANPKIYSKVIPAQKRDDGCGSRWGGGIIPSP